LKKVLELLGQPLRQQRPELRPEAIHHLLLTAHPGDSLPRQRNHNCPVTSIDVLTPLLAMIIRRFSIVLTTTLTLNPVVTIDPTKSLTVICNPLSFFAPLHHRNLDAAIIHLSFNLPRSTQATMLSRFLTLCDPPSG
jgi:hypothetical protein